MKNSSEDSQQAAEKLQRQLAAAEARIAELETQLATLAEQQHCCTARLTIAELLCLLNSCEDHIWFIDRDKKLLLANHASCKAFARDSGVKLQPGQCSCEILPAEVARHYQDAYDQALQGKQSKFDLSTPNGEAYAVMVQPVLQEGQIIGASIFARNVTEHHELQETLRRFEQIISSTPDMISLVDEQYRYLMVNDAYLRNLNLKREMILGKTVRDLVGEDHFRQVSEPCLRKAFAGEVVTVENWMEVPKLGRRYLNVTYHPVHDQDREIRYVAIDVRDATDLKLAEDDRKRIFDVALDMFCVADFKGQFIEINPAWTRILGWSEHELKSFQPDKLIHPEDLEATKTALKRLLKGNNLIGFENRYQCKDGLYKWLAWSSFPDLKRGRIFAAARDVTLRKQMEAELRQLAISDPLTGTSNRRHFLESATAEMRRSRRYGAPLAVLLLDVDHFKAVNDSYGHQIGDEVLVRLVDCCLQELRSTDLFGRFGGEEFAAVLVETEEADALQTCSRLCEQLAKMKIRTLRGDISITVSIGITMLSSDDLSIDQLIKRADDALYKAKNSGRNRIVHY